MSAIVLNATIALIFSFSKHEKQVDKLTFSLSLICSFFLYGKYIK